MISSSKKLGLLSRAPQRFLTRRLRKLTLSPAFQSKAHLGSLSFWGVALLLIFFSGSFGIFPSFLAREALLDRAAPLFRELNKPFEALRSLTEEVRDLISLSSHIKDLRLIEKEKEFWKAEALTLRRENDSLKQAVQFIDQEDSSFVKFPKVKKTTEVIARSPEVYKHHVILEGGKRAGFLKGDVGVNSQGLMGRLTEVGERVSRLLLITDMDSRVPVFLSSSIRPAILAGDGTSFPLVTRLQEDMMKPPPHVGELVYTSGEGGIFPPHIPVGVIVRDAEDNYRVHPFVDLETFSVVGIIPSYVPILEDFNFESELKNKESL